MYKYPLTFNDFCEKDINDITLLFKEGNLTSGRVTKEYEILLASYFGSKFAIAVNSGSSANLLMLAALLYSNDANYSLCKGDEVLVPAVSWITTYSPILQLGLVPKIVDVDDKTFNISPDALKSSITSKTKCVFAVNLLGEPCEFDEIIKICDDNNLLLLEDNCESMGAKYKDKYSGTIGLMSSQSTYMSHHISTIEGGFILTDNEYLKDILISLRSHGWARGASEESRFYKDACKGYLNRDLPDDFLFLLPGFNLRTTEINSKLGINHLPKLDEYVKSRRSLSLSFKKILEKFKEYFYSQYSYSYSSCFGFAIISRRNNDLSILKQSLEENGFQTRPIVTGNIMRHPVSRYFPKQKLLLQNADLIHNQGLFIGNHFRCHKDAIDSFSQSLNVFK